MANGTNGDAAVPVIDKSSPDYRLVPGDIGYAPPARIAPEVGVLTAEQLGHYAGNNTSANVHGTVPLAMPPPAPATVSSDTAYAKPSQLTAAQAGAQLDKAIGDWTTWILDIPYSYDGKKAVVIQFFRDLEARQKARGTAATLGRLVEPDQVDNATSTPPPEFFQLRHAAQQIVALQDVYGGTLAKSGLTLSGQDQAAVDGILKEFAPLAAGPTAPDETVDAKAEADAKADAKEAKAEAKADAKEAKAEAKAAAEAKANAS